MEEAMFRTRVTALVAVLVNVLWVSAAQAQQRGTVSISDELPHLELSVGMASMAGGSGVGAEQTMSGLRLADWTPRFRRRTMPWTQAGFGLFAQAHMAVSPHAMLGYMVSLTQHDTHGSRTSETSAVLPVYTHVAAHQEVKTRALIVSARPNARIKFGAGPAVHQRLFEIQGPQAPQGSVKDLTLGWVAGGEVMLHRGRTTYEQPAHFVKVMGQYRAAGNTASEPLEVSLGRSPTGKDLGSVSWPSTDVRFSHWMIGVGIGIEF
jgi:hypothetical protein